jgi:hypothetical protein
LVGLSNVDRIDDSADAPDLADRALRGIALLPGAKITFERDPASCHGRANRSIRQATVLLQSDAHRLGDGKV